jgi:DNA-binding cell septation regulator SpoVG
MNNNPLEIKVTRVYPTNKENLGIKAFVDITVNGSFQIKNIKVCQSTKKGNGIFVGYPAEQGDDKKWYEMVKPITKEAREEVSKVVLSAYKEKVKEQV